MAAEGPALRRAVSIRDAAPTDFERIVALNLAEVVHTSAMDVARLAALHSLSCYHKVACVDLEVSGFLLAMRSGARYDNENFQWFAGRYSDFIYVDRIVVAVAAKGLHLGTLLYEDLFRYARNGAIPLVTCEYNVVPANEPSRLFHDKFGFKEQGRQWLAGSGKQVSLQTAELNTSGNQMLQGNCHCGAVKWEFDGMPDGATACNCTVCRRYGVLWIYDYEGAGIRVAGTTKAYIRGKAIEFHFCPTCGCVAFWRSRTLDESGRRRIAVNLRLTEPEAVARVPIDHFDGLDKFEDLPRDGRCVADYWF